MSQRWIVLSYLSRLLGSCLALTGCSQGPAEAPQASPPTVTVSYPVEREVTDYAEFPGRTAAVDSVQVRARVSGYLEKINFAEGADVQQGDVLYQIDPRTYQAALDQTEAQVRLQQANLKYQEALYNRDVRLLSTGAVSQEDLQKDLAARDTAQASLNAAKAAVKQAQLNLDWTKVTAPISGRIGRTLVTQGNLVVADQTVLTTIVSEDPMYAYFDVDEPTVLRVQQLIREGKYKSAREPGVKVPVFLGLSSEQNYPHQGYVDFINNQVNPSTGTLQIRGIFANPKPPRGPRLLSPGLFVRIRVAVSAPYRALLVSQAAILTDQNLKYVYVVNGDNRVSRHVVALGAQENYLQVIQTGVGPKERVVVKGLQHIKPGMLVNPRLVPMPMTSPTEGQPGTPPAEAASPAPVPPQPAPGLKQTEQPQGPGTR